jgi:hypothetical protein
MGYLELVKCNVSMPGITYSYGSAFDSRILAIEILNLPVFGTRPPSRKQNINRSRLHREVRAVQDRFTVFSTAERMELG